LSKEWFLLRKCLITASQLGKVTGLCRYGSRGEAYRKYALGIEPKRTPVALRHMARGKACEPHIIEQFYRATGFFCEPSYFFARGKVGATPDTVAFVTRDEKGKAPYHAAVEVKCPLSMHSDAWQGGEQPPVEHVVQLYCQCYCCNLEDGFLVAGGSDGFKVWQFRFNMEAWRQCIEPGVNEMLLRVAMENPPPMQNGKKDLIAEFLRLATAPGYMRVYIDEQPPSPDLVHAIEISWGVRE